MELYWNHTSAWVLSCIFIEYVSEHLLLRIALKGYFCRTCNYSNKEYKMLHTFALKLHYNCSYSSLFPYETGRNKGKGAGLENMVLSGLLQALLKRFCCCWFWSMFTPVVSKAPGKCTIWFPCWSSEKELFALLLLLLLLSFSKTCIWYRNSIFLISFLLTTFLWEVTLELHQL